MIRKESLAAFNFCHAYPCKVCMHRICSLMEIAKGCTEMDGLLQILCCKNNGYTCSSAVAAIDAMICEQRSQQFANMH